MAPRARNVGRVKVHRVAVDRLQRIWDIWHRLVEHRRMLSTQAQALLRFISFAPLCFSLPLYAEQSFSPAAIQHSIHESVGKSALGLEEGRQPYRRRRACIAVLHQQRQHMLERVVGGPFIGWQFELVPALVLVLPVLAN